MRQHVFMSHWRSREVIHLQAKVFYLNGNIHVKLEMEHDFFGTTIYVRNATIYVCKEAECNACVTIAGHFSATPSDGPFHSTWPLN